jgi:hypothetical protein
MKKEEARKEESARYGRIMRQRNMSHFTGKIINYRNRSNYNFSDITCIKHSKT